MPGPPSQLHRPALLFSCVAGLITYPRDCAHTHRHTHLFLTVFLSILLSRVPSSPPFFLSLLSYSALTLLLLTFLSFFSSSSVTLSHSSLTPGTSTLLFPFYLSPFLHFLCFFPFVTFCFLLSFSLHSFSIGSLLLSDSSILAPSPSLSFTYTFILI